MGMALAENILLRKILSRAGGGSKVKPGDVAVVDVERAILPDMTFLPEGWRDVAPPVRPCRRRLGSIRTG